MEPERRRRIIETYRQRAPTYDSGLALAQRWRLWPRTHGRAVSRLALQPGDVVLDVGCGTGLSFPHIEAAIGEAGRLIGIDLSPDMLAKAQERVDATGWRNVTLLESAVEEAEVGVAADAMLLHFAGEIQRSRAAMENLVRQVKPGARLAAAGTKRLPPWGWPVNAYVWLLAMGFGRPEEELGPYLEGLRVESLLLGGVYVAWGRVRTMA